MLDKTIISILPPELHSHITSFADYETLINLSQTSRFFYSSSGLHEQMHQKLVTDFDFPAVYAEADEYTRHQFNESLPVFFHRLTKEIRTFLNKEKQMNIQRENDSNILSDFKKKENMVTQQPERNEQMIVFIANQGYYHILSIMLKYAKQLLTNDEFSELVCCDLLCHTTSNDNLPAGRLQTLKLLLPLIGDNINNTYSKIVKRAVKLRDQNVIITDEDIRWNGDVRQSSALANAIINNDKEAIKLLLEYGANKYEISYFKREKWEMCAAEYASKYCSKEICDILNVVQEPLEQVEENLMKLKM